MYSIVIIIKTKDLYSGNIGPTYTRTPYGVCVWLDKVTKIVKPYITSDFMYKIG